MKHIIKVLVVSALMVILMATTMSPAFAGGGSDHNRDGTAGYSKWWQDNKTGTSNETDGCDRDGNRGWHEGQDC